VGDNRVVGEEMSFGHIHITPHLFKNELKALIKEVKKKEERLPRPPSLAKSLCKAGVITEEQYSNKQVFWRDLKTGRFQ